MAQPSTCRDRPWLFVANPSAGSYGPWTGKWLVWVPAAQVEQAWAQVALATLQGRLGCMAKVSTAGHPDNSDGKHVICVYVVDCRDLAEVRRVLGRLRSLGHTGRLVLKEDGATYAGVYGRGASLYVAQAGQRRIEQRRQPIPVPANLLEGARQAASRRIPRARQRLRKVRG
jgi:hypothetical protein